MTRFVRGVGYLFVGIGLAGFALGTTFHGAFVVTACGACFLYLWPKAEA